MAGGLGLLPFQNTCHSRIYMKQKILLSVFIVALLWSCNRSSICGYYVSNQHLALHTLFIKADSSYNLGIYNGDLNPHHSIGKWKIQGDSLILNSNYDISSLPLEVNEVKDNSEVKFTFNINNNSKLTDEEIDNYQLIINDTIIYDLGKILPKTIVAQQRPTFFYITAYCCPVLYNANNLLKTKKYFVNQYGNNRFNINLSIEPSLFLYETIKNLKLYYKRNFIYWNENTEKLKRVRKGSVTDYHF